MGKIYDKTAGNFKATTLDAKIIDAQKIMVWDGSSDITNRINLLDVINEDGTNEDGIKHYHEQVSATNATSEGESSGFKIATENVPHEWSIEKIEIPVLNTVTVEHYIGAYIVTDNTKEAILSDNATAWTSGTIATWTFKNNPIKVPTGSSLELYIITGEDGLGQTEGTRSNHKIKTYYNSNGTGFMRYDGVPYHNRDVLCTFSCGDIDLDELNTTIEELQNTTEELSSIVAEINDEKIDTIISEESATGSGEFNAVHFKHQDVPHDFPIKKFILKPLESSNTPLYMAVWTLTQSGQKTYVGLSDEAITWEAGKDAVWTFNNIELIVPENHNVEFFLCTGADAVGGTEATAPGVYIKTKYNPNGRGSIRFENNWHNRCIQATFSNNGYLSHVGDNTHLTTAQREVLNEVISGGFVTKDEFGELLEQSTQKQQYYDTWTNLKDGDIVDKALIYSFQLDKNDFTTGRIDRIEIPYVDGNNSKGYLCVQFFNSSNSAIATYYSINKQKQDKTGSNVRGICEYEFSTFETPADYSYVRFSMVANNWTVPTGNSGIQFRIIPIKRNNTFTWNTNTNTKVNNTGTRWTVLLSVLTRNYAKNTGITVRNYDWTPDVFCPITVTLSTADTAFVAPTNGWIISKSAQTTSGANSLTLNGVEIAKSSGTAQADVQILIRKGEFVTATTAYNLVFYPCKSEQFDYRLEGGHTPYDIWKGAVVYDEYGQPSVKDLYIPDASAWKTEVGSAVTGKIATISGEEALDSNGNVLFNIQSRYIENGSGMFVQSTITSFTSTLDVLNNGTQMFGYSGLTQWNVNLPNLATGDCMFMGCGSLTSFTADLHSLSSGWYFFTNCSNLTDVSFVGGLDTLTNGTYMFKGCSLSYTSLNNILNALPTRNGNVIEITVADTVANDMVDDERFTDAEIPPFSGSTYFSFTHNGWEVRLTSQTGFVVGTLAPTPYDVTEENGYIPDASAWNDDMGYDGLDIKDNITRVSNEIAYNDNN